LRNTPKEVSMLNSRKDIEDSYTVEDGVIRSPGKFEGEPIYVPYFWEVYLEGFGEEMGDYVLFDVEPSDIVEFPELKGKTMVKLTENDQGFVMEV
jgi:hypothetical protein